MVHAIDKLIQISKPPEDPWGIETTMSEPVSVSITPPLDHPGSKTLQSGEQLVFLRSFDGRIGKKGYSEVLQKFTHIFDLHFVETRNAFCRLDKHGDIEDMIRIVEPLARGTDWGGTIISFDRTLLDEYLVLTGSTIVRTFDFTRYRESHFNGWSDRHDIQHQDDGSVDLFYRSHVEPSHASYMRGFQIVQIVSSEASKDRVIKRYSYPVPAEEREYASFIAYDWKNQVIAEISCAPEATSNYFTKSDLPFELSPAFFRPEVLIKYKADSEKYRLENRSISCRGSWHLQTYDINEADQVHTYLVYLRNLPYEEQLYWKSHNEAPKGPISKRAFETDFEGKWSSEYDPLRSLKAKLQEWDHAQIPWWTLRDEKLPDKVHYPVTASHDEWATEIMNLDQLVVEGFESKWLRAKTTELARAPDIKYGSLKLVEECLRALGHNDDDARKITLPLKTTQFLRTKLKGHAAGNDAASLRIRALKEHKTLKAHFRRLCQDCDESIRTLDQAFAKLR